uniref:Uncharacterized protein n=1 Tax=viral metagenome TaxID=1070528 RepID=A0A6H2A3X9_9ZZZZ
MDEAKVKKILEKGAFQEDEDGGLYSLESYLRWNVDDSEACLDGYFTADDLEAIAWWMNKKG